MVAPCNAYRHSFWQKCVRPHSLQDRFSASGLTGEQSNCCQTLQHVKAEYDACRRAFSIQRRPCRHRIIYSLPMQSVICAASITSHVHGVEVGSESSQWSSQQQGRPAPSGTQSGAIAQPIPRRLQTAQTDLLRSSSSFGHQSIHSVSEADLVTSSSGQERHQARAHLATYTGGTAERQPNSQLCNAIARNVHETRVQDCKREPSTPIHFLRPPPKGR